MEVHNTLFPDHTASVEEFRFEDESWDLEKYAFKRYVAIGPREEVLGFGEYGHSPWVFHHQKFWMDVNVHPRWQRQGIGTLLYDHLMEELLGLRGIEVRSSAQENRPEGIRFLTKRDFTERMRTWESVLDLSRFDPSGFRDLLEHPKGVELTTLAQESAHEPQLDLKLHQLATDLERDVPLPGKYTPVPFDLFRQWILKSPGALPEGYFLAKVGEEYVGQCVLHRQIGMEGSLRHGLTGVRREYRRRGIAMILKVTALRWAKEAGYRAVRTWNDSTNEGMLAINRKLGFQRRPAWISFVKQLGTT